ncbi:DnaJ domain-containing protein [Amnibacterium flavum]|uniref:Molecular chaperone DnaJ n=1 Tax=Amnibacterium flavum TaxID=2173173 RepID=A0A2V1HTP7_9MICO|nr:DnaJ domain-containing protein [Amnibacterium flavum]PVZ93687.1 molecular chaperone DnaJ [Amnibacterium flavum]
MSDSPASASPYETLGVGASASDDELRKAYRRLLRSTHPDTGGDAVRFTAVQLAWEQIGTPEARADYDRGARPGSTSRSWAPAPPRQPAQQSRPTARSYGHPGGWRRERYLRLMQEWVGRGVEIEDPYAAELVHSAPRELRRLLADALAEESTARALSSLGIGYTVWHDVATGDPDEKIDHVVLGPTGLFAILSEDYGGPVRARRGELIGDAVDDEKPRDALVGRAKRLARRSMVKFSGMLIVLPDDHLAEPIVPLGSASGAIVAAVRRSVLPALLRDGFEGARPVGGTEIFDLRSRLQARITHVE